MRFDEQVEAFACRANEARREFSVLDGLGEAEKNLADRLIEDAVRSGLSYFNLKKAIIVSDDYLYSKAIKRAH